MENTDPLKQRLQFIEETYRPAVYYKSWLFEPGKAVKSINRLLTVQIMFMVICIAVLLLLPLIAKIKGRTVMELWDKSGLMVTFAIVGILSTGSYFKERLIQGHRYLLIHSHINSQAPITGMEAWNASFFKLANRRPWLQSLLLLPPLLLASYSFLANADGSEPLLIWRYMIVVTPLIIAILLTEEFCYLNRLSKNITAFRNNLVPNDSQAIPISRS